MVAERTDYAALNERIENMRKTLRFRAPSPAAKTGKSTTTRQASERRAVLEAAVHFPGQWVQFGEPCKRSTAGNTSSLIMRFGHHADTPTTRQKLGFMPEGTENCWETAVDLEDTRKPEGPFVVLVRFVPTEEWLERQTAPEPQPASITNGDHA